MPKIRVRRRQHDRAHLAVVDARQEFERLRISAGFLAIAGQQARPVRLQSGKKRGRRGIKLADRAGLVVGLASELALQTLRQARLAARRTADDRQELLVDEQLALGEPLVPLAADRRAERGFELTAGSDGHATADDVMVEHEARIEHAA